MCTSIQLKGDVLTLHLFLAGGTWTKVTGPYGKKVIQGPLPPSPPPPSP
jgi:hypothetical protein